MKKLMLPLIGICLIATIVCSESGRKYYERESVDTIVVDAQYSALENNNEILTDTGLSAGTHYVIDKVIFSAATATFMYLNDSATTGDIGYGYYRVANNGTVIDGNICLNMAAGCGVYVTIGGASEVLLEYHIE